MKKINKLLLFGQMFLLALSIAFPLFVQNNANAQGGATNSYGAQFVNSDGTTRTTIRNILTSKLELTARGSVNAYQGLYSLKEVKIDIGSDDDINYYYEHDDPQKDYRVRIRLEIIGTNNPDDIQFVGQGFTFENGPDKEIPIGSVGPQQPSTAFNTILEYTRFYYTTSNNSVHAGEDEHIANVNQSANEITETQLSGTSISLQHPRPGQDNIAKYDRPGVYRFENSSSTVLDGSDICTFRYSKDVPGLDDGEDLFFNYRKNASSLEFMHANFGNEPHSLIPRQIFFANEATYANILDAYADPITCADGINPAVDSDGNPIAGGGAGGTDESCEGNAGPLSWFICGTLNLTGQMLRFIDEQVRSLLSIPREYYEAPGVENSWRSFRDLAYFILVIIALVMVISTALGFEFVSAYTIKKALPRFVIAVIFIALSYEIIKLAILLTEDLGRGLLGFTSNAFAPNAGEISLTSLYSPGAGEGIFSSILGPIGLASAAIWVVAGGYTVLIGFAVSALFVIGGVLILLMFRQILVIVLMIVAPVAILSWIFPGNDKLWGIWKGAFIGLLGLFPIVALMIGVGRGFAFVTDSAISSQSDSTGTVILAGVLKLVAYISPYFLIPSAFKYAGSAFNSVAGMLDKNRQGFGQKARARVDRSTGADQRRKDKLRSQEDAGQRRQAKRYGRERGAGFLARKSAGVSELAAIQTQEESKKKIAGIKAFKANADFNATAAKDGRSAALTAARERAIELQGSTKFEDQEEYSALVGLLGQQKDIAGVDMIQKAALQSGSNAARENWNKAMSTNYGALKPVAPHLATEVTAEAFGSKANPAIAGDTDQAARQRALDEDRAKAFAGSSVEGLSEMKADSWGEYAKLDLAGATKGYAAVHAKGGETAAKLDPGGLDSLYDAANGHFDKKKGAIDPQSAVDGATRKATLPPRPSSPGMEQSIHDFLHTARTTPSQRPPKPTL